MAYTTILLRAKRTSSIACLSNGTDSRSQASTSMANRAHFRECPVCGQSFGDAVFETHVDLCIKASFIKEAAKPAPVYSPVQLVDQIADVEARLFQLLDVLDGTPASTRLDSLCQRSARHLSNSLENARRVRVACDLLPAYCTCITVMPVNLQRVNTMYERLGAPLYEQQPLVRSCRSRIPGTHTNELRCLFVLVLFFPDRLPSESRRGW